MADRKEPEVNECARPLLATVLSENTNQDISADRPEGVGDYESESQNTNQTKSHNVDQSENVNQNANESSKNVNHQESKNLNESNSDNTHATYNLREQTLAHNGVQSGRFNSDYEARRNQTGSTGNLPESATGPLSDGAGHHNGVCVGGKVHTRSKSETFKMPPPHAEVTILVNGTISDYVGGSVSSGSNIRHRIRLEEVVPSTSSYLDYKESSCKEWKTDLDGFTSKRYEDEEGRKKLPKQVRRYYKMQDELITAFENIQLEVDDAMENAESEARLRRMANILAKVSFVCNLLLLIGKAIAAGLSGSLAVISSVVDSAVDLMSGALMWWSNRAMKTRNIYEYPQGRTKLEPVAIVILAVVMSLASVQMIRESVQKIVQYATVEAIGPVFEIPSIVICSLTVVTKLCLFLVCRRYRTPSVDALTQDHRNDVMSNTLAVACGLMGYKVWAYADPIGAIVISLYIIVSWFSTGWEQIKMLTGHTARPDFLKKITFIALNHHSKILLIDTVRAFHFGNNFLVEVDIVLPEMMTLRESHDIGETLQLKIERLPEVERAFVHLDYETEHSPCSEHKVV